MLLRLGLCLSSFFGQWGVKVSCAMARPPHSLSLSLSLSFIAAALHALGSIEECGEELGADGSRARVGESGSATSMGCGWRSSDAELDSWTKYVWSAKLHFAAVHTGYFTQSQ